MVAVNVSGELPVSKTMRVSRALRAVRSDWSVAGLTWTSTHS